MKLSSEHSKQLQEKLAAEKDPAKAAKIVREYGIDVSAEDLEQVSGGGRIITEDMLAQVSGGNSEDIPQMQIIRDMYRRKGPNTAFVTCLYYIPSPSCHEIIQIIEEEEKAKG